MVTPQQEFTAHHNVAEGIVNYFASAAVHSLPTTWAQSLLTCVMPYNSKRHSVIFFLVQRAKNCEGPMLNTERYSQY